MTARATWQSEKKKTKSHGWGSALFQAEKRKRKFTQEMSDSESDEETKHDGLPSADPHWPRALIWTATFEVLVGQLGQRAYVFEIHDNNGCGE